MFSLLHARASARCGIVLIVAALLAGCSTGVTYETTLTSKVSYHNTVEQKSVTLKVPNVLPDAKGLVPEQGYGR